MLFQRFITWLNWGMDGRAKIIPDVKKNAEIVGIQYLRGICAVAVVLDHVAGMASFPKYMDQVFLDNFFSSGALGVGLFFLISGFIISVSCLRANLAPRFSFSAFAKKRFVRIVPLMWCAVLSYALLRMAGRADAGDYMPYLRGMFPLVPGEVAPLNIWTLRYEFIFYIVFALAFLGGARCLWVLAAWAAAPFLYAWFFAAGADGMGGPFLAMLASPVNIEFMAGLGLGVCYLKYSGNFVIRLPFNACWILSLLFLAYMGIGFYAGITLDGFGNTMLASFFCAIILFVGIHIHCKEGKIKKIGELLGDASYSIYLFHPAIVSALLGVWAHFAKHAPVAVVIGVTVLITVLATICIHLVVEKPLVRAIRKRLV